jgi:hypothetical protein
MRCRRRLKPQFAGSQRQALPPQPRAPPSQAQPLPLSQVRPSQAQPLSLPLPQVRFS